MDEQIRTIYRRFLGEQGVRALDLSGSVPVLRALAQEARRRAEDGAFFMCREVLEGQADFLEALVDLLDKAGV